MLLLFFGREEAIVQIYRQQRNYENLNRRIFDGVGEYGFPEIKPASFDVDNWISFNYARTCEEPEEHGVHFFVDDYQFLRLWTNPDTYLPMLSRFQAVCTPDFSTYTDFPRAVQIYNHYRKHWLGAYWQEHGIRVIPTISWSDESSFDWCFDGEPVGSMVVISSVGTQGSRTATRLFEAGYREMLQRLAPTAIVLYGSIPWCCEAESGMIISVRAFQDKWRADTEQEDVL